MGSKNRPNICLCTSILSNCTVLTEYTLTTLLSEKKTNERGSWVELERDKEFEGGEHALGRWRSSPVAAVRW